MRLNLEVFTKIVLFFWGSLLNNTACSQSADSLTPAGSYTHSPHKATVYSLILPGAGQVYNKKYWKVPVIYGLMGTSGVLYYDYYQKVATQNAQFRSMYAAGTPPSVYQLEQRDNDRVNRDMMGLSFVLIYVLQVVDATVDAHFYGFDIDQKLSMSWFTTPSQLLSFHYHLDK
jgi:hypothetical protein